MVTEYLVSHPLSAGASVVSSASWDEPQEFLASDPQLRAATSNVEIKWLTRPPSLALCSLKEHGVARGGLHEMLIILRQ